MNAELGDNVVLALFIWVAGVRGLGEEFVSFSFVKNLEENILQK